MASLREVLAQRVEESRREALERQPRLGYFSAFENRPKIVFTTRGRVTGLPREKWWLPFAPDGDTLYLLEETGVDADWVRNIVADRRVIVDGVELLARIVGDEREVERARQLCGARCARLGLLVGDLIERCLVIAVEHPGSVALHALSNAAAGRRVGAQIDAYRTGRGVGVLEMSRRGGTRAQRGQSLRLRKMCSYGRWMT